MSQPPPAASTTAKPKKKSAPPPTIGLKAEPVITADEVGRILDLGLGRGVDATDPSPWFHKSSFQVRRVSIENIIGTEEGGSLQSYEREVSSVTTQQTDLKASVAVPQAPVSLGLEGEQSRSVSTTRKAIGKRVVNRTVSFASQFDDLAQSSTLSEQTEAAQKDTIVPKVVYPNSTEKHEAAEERQNIFTFEERLAKWILERIINRSELAKRIEDQSTPTEMSLIKGLNPMEDLSNYLNAVDREAAKQIVSDCADFVKHFRITHYVSSISLGAATYRILSATEYLNKISAKGTFGFETIANLVVSESFSKKTVHRASDVRQIGRIVNEKVARGTYDEAVIGIGILPLHQLVQLRFLHLALRKALLDYIAIQGDTSSGPFLISCGDSGIYWKVNETAGFCLEATRIQAQASPFYIIPTDNGDHPYEFLIGWLGNNHRSLSRETSTLSQDRVKKGNRMFRYLDGHVSLLGRNSGPLYMRNDIDERNARFSLQNRLFSSRSGPVDLREWVLGKDQFFINCTRRRGRIDGYLAIKATNAGQPNQTQFRAVCVSSVKHHNEANSFMLFSLTSPSAGGEQVSPAAAKSPELLLDYEFDAFVGDSKPPRLSLSDPPISGHPGGLEMKKLATAENTV